MNIALSALIIFILLLPGAVSLNAYYTTLREPNSSNLHISFTDLLLKGLLISLCVHFLGLSVLHLFGGYVNFQRFYDILTANKINIEKQDLSKSVLQFLAYNLSLSFVTYITTKLIKKIIVDQSWDLRFNALRATNYWFIVFSGRYLDQSPKKQREEIDFIYIDVLTKKDIVYSGILREFKYSPAKGELETLILSNAAKRTYISVENEHHKLRLDEPAFIKGDIFIITMEDVLNMNISYIKVQEGKENPEQTTIDFLDKN